MRYLFAVCLCSLCGLCGPLRRRTDGARRRYANGVDKQLADATPASAEHPEFSGMMVWSGRADREYKPFFQWELRLQAGVEPLRGLRLRIQPLAPDLSPLQKGRIGHWQTLGNVDAGDEVDASYKFNTPIFSAYRVEVTWKGGKPPTWPPIAKCYP